MKNEFALPVFNEELHGYDVNQFWEVRGYLEGLKQAGALTSYDFPKHGGGKGSNVFYAQYEIPDNSPLADLIETTMRETYKAFKKEKVERIQQQMDWPRPRRSPTVASR